MSDLGISEIFKSIQGEGILSGRPSIFIRFSGCNQSCVWCDTPDKPSNENITPFDVMETIRENPDHDVVITGGEPMLHSNVVSKIIMAINQYAYREITIETNGTIAPYYWSPTLWSISPKLHSSGTEYSPSIIQQFCNVDNANLQFKFVVSEDDEQDLIDFVDICSHIDNTIPIIVQPVAYDNDAKTIYMSRYKSLIKTILDLKLPNNIRITPQLHKLIWGFDSEGV